MQIIVRAAVVFGFLFLVTRLIGKRQLGQMNAFEFVLLAAWGDLVQQGVTQEDYSLTGAFFAIGTFSVLATALSWLSWRFPRARGVIDGRPTVVVRDGHFLEEVLRAERLPVDEVLQAMREQGIRDPLEVDLGILEPNGNYSFFTRTA